MKRDQLIKILEDLLDTETDFNFLRELKKEELEKLVALIRERMDQVKE